MSALWGSILWGGSGSVGAISPATLPASQVGASYSQTLTATGGVAPYTWAITAGAAPTGLTLSAGGVLSGTTSTVGVFVFTVTSTDVTTNTATISYSIAVTAIVLPPPSSYGLRFTNISRVGVTWS